MNKDKWNKLIRVFFDFPLEGFQIRELSRKLNISPPSLYNGLKELNKQDLIIVKQHKNTNYPIYFANRENEHFKYLKRNDGLNRINDVILQLKSKYPSVIVLFGSYSIGEDIEGSDIDIFIESDKFKINLLKYEKILNRKINLLFCNNFNSLSNELKNNILNGVKLYGYLEVF